MWSVQFGQKLVLGTRRERARLRRDVGTSRGQDVETEATTLSNGIISVTLNGVMAVILRYSPEFVENDAGVLFTNRKSHVYELLIDTKFSDLE